MALILVSEFMLDEALALLREAMPVTYDPELHRKPALLRRLLASASAWIVRNQSPVRDEFLAAAPRLRVVGRLGAGLDNIDQAALARLGIRLCLAEGANALSVAEWVLAYLCHVSKPLLAADHHVRAGGWERLAFGGFELAGKTLALVGFGAIGKRVAFRARALGLRLLAYDPYLPRHDATARDLDVTVTDLDPCLREADFLSIHCPLTPETHGLIDLVALRRMRPEAHLINTARGGIVDEGALAKALADGTIAGAWLDVRESEPPPKPDPLAALPNCLLTPHCTGLTREARQRVDLMVARAVLAALGAPAADA